MVIPACPLALTSERKFDERRQRALCRYYAAAGAGGLAVGVHTTQFAIREPQLGLYRPVLELAAAELSRLQAATSQPLLRIAGVCGDTRQAVREAETARELGYDAALLSLAAMGDATDDALIAHCRAVSEVLPLFGFYLQPAVGGRVLSYPFWRRFAEIENVVAVKIAPFNRYQTLDVVRAVAESGRRDIALYTGNDDNIVVDLLTPFHFQVEGRSVEMRIVGGLLGQWAVWTRRAVELLEICHSLDAPLPPDSGGLLTMSPPHAGGRGASSTSNLLTLAAQLTDANAAIFDAANGFAGCIPGIHEILGRQGLLAGTWCLDPHEQFSSGQREEIDRIYAAYPRLTDDDFVREHLDEWLG